jgi:SAM-dependent methyltransferase
VTASTVPFRAAFDCLWCGQAWTTRSTADLEGWASLCPDCLGRAQENPFLRFRLKTALRERSEQTRPEPVADDAERLKAYSASRAVEYDDWYQRRGRYSRGPVLDVPWDAELDEVGRWLDGVPLRGEIVELSAGTGWWSPILAEKGELSIYDAVPEMLDLARRRLVAHGLRAHIHVRDAWDEPDRQVDAVFAAFWLARVPADRLDAFVGLARRWLKQDGILALVDLQDQPGAGAFGWDDGIAQHAHSTTGLQAALKRAGFEPLELRGTAHFFLMAAATATGVPPREAE